MAIPILKILTAASAFLPFLKKKKFCLWYHANTRRYKILRVGVAPIADGGGLWVKKAGPFSKSQCRKTQKELEEGRAANEV